MNIDVIGIVLLCAQLVNRHHLGDIGLYNLIYQGGVAKMLA